MRPPRIAYLVVMSIHEVNDGMARPNVTRAAVTFSHSSGRCAVLAVTPCKTVRPKESEKNPFPSIDELPLTFGGATGHTFIERALAANVRRAATHPLVAVGAPIRGDATFGPRHPAVGGGPTAISFCLAVEVVEAHAPVMGRPIFLRVLYLVDLTRHLCMFANAVVVPSLLFHPFRAAFPKVIESVLCALGGLRVPQVRLASK